MTLTDVTHNYTNTTGSSQRRKYRYYEPSTPKEQRSYNDFNVKNSAVISTEVKTMALFMVVIRSLDITQKATNRGRKVQTSRHKLLKEVKQS